jgi:hypothetical protein
MRIVGRSEMIGAFFVVSQAAFAGYRAIGDV